MKKLFSAPVVCALVGATFLAACGDEEPSTSGTGGKATTGGSNTGGTSTGGTAGSSTGGTPTGGTGGAPTGGAAGGGAGGRAGGAGGQPGGAAGAPGGAGGAGGMGGGGAGGAGGMMCGSPLMMAGMGGMAGMAGAGAGAGGAGAGGAGAGGAGAGGAGAGGAGAGGAGAGGAGAGGGGAGGAAPTLPRVIATFDTPGSLNMPGIGNWGPGGQPMSMPPLPDTLVSRNATEGFSCAGSAELRVPFTAYGQQQDIQINFSPVQDWTGATRLHARVKIPNPGTGNLNHINGVQFAVLSENYANYDGAFTPVAMFADFAWHSIMIDLTAATNEMPPRAPQLTSIIQVQIQIQTAAMAPATGPAAPVTTTMLVDDVWIQ